MPTLSAPRLTPIAPSAQPETSPRSPDAQLSTTGPETDRQQERLSIYKLITNKLFGTSTPSSMPARQVDQAAAVQQQLEGQTMQSQPEKVTALAQIKAQLFKFTQIRSLGDFALWVRDTAVTCAQAFTTPVSAPQKRPVNVPLRPSETHPTYESPIAHIQSKTEEPKLKPSLEVNFSSSKSEDYTGKGLAQVAEATRAVEIKEDKEKALDQDQREQTKHRIKDLVVATDMRDGGINIDLSAILNEFDGTYGSAEVAIRKIVDAQAKEAAMRRKKIM